MTYVIIFLYISILVGLLFQSKSSLIPCISISVVLATLAAFRGSDVASDFTVYEDWYNNGDLGVGLLVRPGLFEYLYFLLNDFFAVHGIYFRFFIWLLAFFAVFIKVNVVLSFAKSGWAVGVSILIYSLSFYLLHEFTQIRIGLAIAFIFLAVRALVVGSRTHFAVLVVLATGFHSSAIMALFLLLPYRGSTARWVDWGLLVCAGVLVVMASFGVAAGAVFSEALAIFDPRLEFYISLASTGQSEAANPFSVSALLMLVLALSLIGVEYNRRWICFLDKKNIHMIILVRRSILIGLSFLVSLSPIPELALRLFEFNIVLIPIIAAIFFSQSGWILQKGLLLLWTSAIAYIFIFRDEGLVHSYVLFFS